MKVFPSSHSHFDVSTVTDQIDSEITPLAATNLNYMVNLATIIESIAPLLGFTITTLFWPFCVTEVSSEL